MSSGVQAVIFDCFGVLASDGWLKFKREFFGDAPDKMERATELNHLLDAGLMTYRDFLEEVGGMANIAAVELDRRMKSVVANDELFAFIAEHLKPHYKIGLLSNVSDDWLFTLFSREQRALFDATALSHEIGAIKPDPQAYEAIASRLDVPMQSCVFVDDQPHNVAGAQDVGMQAFRFENLDQATCELQRLTTQG